MMNPTEAADPVLARPRLVRRRRWSHVFFGSALLAQAAALYIALSRAPDTRVIRRVEHTATTDVVTVPLPPQLVPVPIAAPVADPRACPTPRTDAPRITPPALPEDVHGLSVSPTNAGWIAAWNDDHIYISSDAGRTFRRVLDGTGLVREVAFDCFGRAIAIRGERLGVIDGGRERWPAIPGIDLADQIGDGASWPAKVALIGGGRDIIVVGTAISSIGDAPARVAMTRDGGATWTYRDLAAYASSSEDISGYQRADGTIVVGVQVPDCRSDDLVWVEIKPDKTTTEHWVWMPGGQFELYGDRVYTSSAWRDLRAPDTAEWTQLPDEPSLGMPIRAPYPVLVSDDRATRLANTTAKPYPWVIEGVQHAMDPAGRLWSIVCGQPWIASAQASGRECGAAE